MSKDHVRITYRHGQHSYFRNQSEISLPAPPLANSLPPQTPKILMYHFPANLNKSKSQRISSHLRGKVLSRNSRKTAVQCFFLRHPRTFFSQPHKDRALTICALRWKPLRAFLHTSAYDGLLIWLTLCC